MRAALALILAACPGPAITTPAPLPEPEPEPEPEPDLFRVSEPPAGIGATSGRVAARVIALGDSQLHHMYGKRTFAQSPWADRVLSLEVAIRPAALDDGADLLLETFLAERRARYPGHTLVYMGDAADLSCTQEYERFFAVMAAEKPFLMVTSNHDGFYAGNFTQKADADGGLALTDMPLDWSRACADPGSLDDRRLTKARAVAKIAAALPAAPRWATDVSVGKEGDPSGYKQAWLAYVRPLGGGDPGVPQAWGVFVDTVDYRGFELTRARGAGTVGHISDEQLRFLDKAMFEARVGASETPAFVMFGHHPVEQLSPSAVKRLFHFLDTHPEIVGVVSAHTHVSDERRIQLPSGRVLPELIVGSTTDAPNAARLLEVRVGPAGLASWRLVIDVDRVCEGIAPLANDSFGYVAYRVSRDDTPDVSLDVFDKIAYLFGLTEWQQERIVQTAGAMLVENDLVRATAALYRHAPVAFADGAQAGLDGIMARRYAGAETLGDLPKSARAARESDLSLYERWVDPVLSPAVPLLARVLHSFAANRATLEALRASRTATPEARRWFTCHAARAAAAEAQRPRAKGNVTYVP